MSRAYRHPASYRPALALGGHCWTFTNAEGFDWFTCAGCYVTVPRWALAEGFWRNLAGSYCLGVVRALESGRVPRAPDLCPIRGDAVVGRDGDQLVWLRSDPEIHIAVELLADVEAVAFIRGRYEIDEYCPYGSRTRHARLRAP